MNFESPQKIKDLHDLGHDLTADDDFIDFEGYGKFLDADETAHLMHCWTGDKNYSGSEFRVFGCSGDGSEYAFWLLHPERAILEQPVVLLESEGQAYTVSTNYSDFLWVLFGNEARASHSIREYVAKNTTTPKRTPDEIIDEANQKYDFYTYIMSKVVY